MGNGGECIGEKGVLWGDGVDGEAGFCDLLGVVLEDLGSGPQCFQRSEGMLWEHVIN